MFKVYGVWNVRQANLTFTMTFFLQKERKYYAVDAGVYKQEDDYNVSYTITEAVIIVLS